MITLAHLSDVHLAPLPPVHWSQLANKRITGFLNWRMNRQKTLTGESTTRLVRHMRERSPDLIAVTGDLVNLGLDAEINTAYNWLQTVGPPETVCVSPGNHDAYVPGSLENCLERWGSYARGETAGDWQFPYVRRAGDVAVISCSSAISTLPWMASGRIGFRQSARLAATLDRLRKEGLFRVVLIHHPPNVEARNFLRGLWNGGLFRKVIAEHGAELILHGHTHRSTIHALPGPEREVPVIGVAAAGAANGGPKNEDPARYNFFRIERDGSDWSCIMREYGYQRLRPDIVMRMQLRIY